MSANVESMFYAGREKPWHGLGTQVEGAPTSADALRLAGLDWTVPYLCFSNTQWRKACVVCPAYRRHSGQAPGGADVSGHGE